MSKRPFITQDDSPNIIIVPTVSFCEPPPKKQDTSDDKTNEKCEQTPGSSKQPESSSESISDDSVINISESSSIKSGDDQCIQSVNKMETLKPSWASNYLLSIGESHNPIKLNLTSTRKKIETLRENLPNKKTSQVTAPSASNMKNETLIKETKSQQSIYDNSSSNTSNDNLTVKLYPGYSICSRPKSEYIYETGVESTKPPTKFDETQKNMKTLNISSDLKNVRKQCSNRDTGLDKQYRNKIIAHSSSSSSKYIASPDKYKYIKNYDQNINQTMSDKEYQEKRIAHRTSKYITTPAKYKYIKKNDQSTNAAGSDKQCRDEIAPCTSKYIAKSNKCKLIKKYQNTSNEYITSKKNVDIYCGTKTSEDKIKYQQTVQSSKKKIARKPQQTLKSKVLKKPSPIRKNNSTTSLYDSQTLKCKDFYANYKIPKISEKNKKQEDKRAETIKDDVSINRLSTKDMFVKELDEVKCSTPVKSVVTVVDDSEPKKDANFDLRSKLSRRSLSHYFTKLRNISECTESAPTEQRDSLLITVPNNTNEKILDTGKRKFEDIKTPKKIEANSSTPKFKKIKLVINVICEKSATSSSDTEDEESLGDTKESNVISNLDLSFLDDFNIDEIVESLCRKETCDLTSIKENAAKDISCKDNTDEINNNKDINNTKTEMVPVCLTNKGKEGSWLMDSDIKKIEKGTSLSNKTLISTGVTVSEINKKCNEEIIKTSDQSIQNKSIKASHANFYEEIKASQKDACIRKNCNQLQITDLDHSETKQEQHLQSSEVIPLKENALNCKKTEEDSRDKITVSNISDISKIAEVTICKENAREFGELSAVLEIRKTNKYITNVHEANSDNQDSLEINNTVKIINSDNVCSTDLTEENNSETISAIRTFLETNTILHLNKNNHVDNVSQTNNSIKEFSTVGGISEINNTNSNDIETFRNICTTRKSSEIDTSINKLEVIEANKILDKIEDVKKYHEKTDNPVKGNVGDIESNTYNIKEVFEIKEMLHKNDIKNVQESSRSNTSNNKDEVMEQAKHIKYFKKTNIDSTECNLNKNIFDDDTEMKLEAATAICSYQTSPIINSQSLNEKPKEFNIFNENQQQALSNTDVSEVIDLTNESDEDSEVFEEKCVHSTDESLSKTNKNKQQSRNETLTENVINTTEYNREPKTENSIQAANDKSVTKTTKYEQELRAQNSIQADDGCFAKTIDHKWDSKTENKIQAASDESITESTKYEVELKTDNSIQEDDGFVTKTMEHKRETKTKNSSQATNEESVTETTKYKGELRTENSILVDDVSITKTIEHDRESKKENSSQPDDEYVTKSTELKQKFKVKCSSKANDDKSVTKITVHKHQTETTNTCQTSTTNKTVAVFEDKRKEKTDIAVDLQETDVYLAKRLEERMQQYLDKKHTITSLLHFGEFSKIFECVTENREKYALKMMDGSKIYRNSQVEYLMKGLQRDVPKENYHCVYLFSGFGFTKHWCIVMELYPKNLKQALQENKKSFHINVIQNLSRQLVSAVTLLRHNNIVHTNIKPTHILVNSANNQLKLCGFDEARYSNSIKFSRNIGTMNYRAPEVILGHSADFKMDVWSTALVMYEMATNIQLFPGTVHNDILYKQMWVCGPFPWEMIRQSKYKNEHFNGVTFMRQLKGGKSTAVPHHIIRKHDLVKKYVHLTYKNDWHNVMNYKLKQLDYAKLHSFCQLLHQMLVMDPQLRLPIEFVYADPFFREY